MRTLAIALLVAGCGLGLDPPADPNSSPGTGSGSGSGSGTATSPLVNVLRVGGAELPISGGVAVGWQGQTLTTYDPTGTQLGMRALSASTAAVLGTGDLDGDGLADVMVLETAPASAPCAAGALDRTLTVVSGKNPQTALYQTTLADTCISINGADPTPYVSLWEGALDGGVPGWLALAPQYASQGWMIGSATSAFYTAETAAYASYSAARPLLQPSAQGLSYMPEQQPFNGFMVTIDGQARYIAATSGRFLQLAIAPLSSGQLLHDSPFLARTDIVGRTYGLLQQDVEGDPHQISLISGITASDLYSDVLAGSASNTVTGTDLWGSIERHVSILDASTGTVAQQFVSYAHDGYGCCADADTYRGRITYPSFARLPSQAGPSRLIYNLFDGNTWNIQISAPGDVAIPSVLAGYYVWDVIPRDADTVDVVASPIDAGRLIQIPDYIVSGTSVVGSWRQATYFPQLTTSVFRWTRTTEQLALVKTFTGIPRLDLGFPRRPTESASSGRLFPTLRASDGAGHAVLQILDASLAPAEQVIDW